MNILLKRFPVNKNFFNKKNNDTKKILKNVSNFKLPQFERENFSCAYKNPSLY